MPRAKDRADTSSSTTPSAVTLEFTMSLEANAWRTVSAEEPVRSKRSMIESAKDRLLGRTDA